MKVKNAAVGAKEHFSGLEREDHEKEAQSPEGIAEERGLENAENAGVGWFGLRTRSGRD